MIAMLVDPWGEIVDTVVVIGCPDEIVWFWRVFVRYGMTQTTNALPVLGVYHEARKRPEGV